MRRQQRQDRLLIAGHLVSHEVNGPGRRLVIFVQGCPLRCPGCFNPETHTFRGGTVVTASQMIETARRFGVTGITISGGEPLVQPRGVFALCRAAGASGFHRIIFTGYTLKELRAHPAIWAGLNRWVDVVIAGPPREKETLAFRGNPTMRFDRGELIVTADGEFVVTGFVPAWKILK